MQNSAHSAAAPLQAPPQGHVTSTSKAVTVLSTGDPSVDGRAALQVAAQWSVDPTHVRPSAQVTCTTTGSVPCRSLWSTPPHPTIRIPRETRTAKRITIPFLDGTGNQVRNDDYTSGISATSGAGISVCLWKDSGHHVKSARCLRAPLPLGKAHVAAPCMPRTRLPEWPRWGSRCRPLCAASTWGEPP